MSKTAAEPLLVYRIVHFDNMKYILKNGIYVAGHTKSDADYVNIGNSEIIGAREGFPVKIKGYGNIGDYVPFYFGRQSIMLYNILTGQNGLTKHTSDNIIYLCCYIDDLIKKCNKFFFTDGQANKKFTEHFTDLNDLKKIDWSLVEGSDFRRDEEDPDKLRRYQAEFLVHEHVPINCINKIVVHNKQRKKEIELILRDNDLNIPVKIANKHFYYFYF